MPETFLLAAVPQWASTWLTPIWLLGAGAIVGLAVLFVLWGITCAVYWPAGRQVAAVVREGPLMPIFVLTALLALFGVFGIFAVRYPGQLFASLARLPDVGVTTQSFQIKPSDADPTLDISEISPQQIDVDWRKDELYELDLRSDVDISVSGYDELYTDAIPRFKVFGGDRFVWRREAGGNPFPEDAIKALYVWNTTDTPTTLTITARTQPAYPQVWAIPVTALIIVGIFGIYFLQRVTMPKVSAVALATAKSEMAQPLFLICMGLGGFFLLLFIFIPYNTFGEDIKMLKDSGLTLIMVLSIITCLWAASNSIAEEIEGRTALSVLSKPIGRRQFILGKFTGIVWVAAVMILILGMIFIATVAYKPLFDYREGAYTPLTETRQVGDLAPTWQNCFDEVAQTAPGLALAFFEVIVLVAISVAVSTRLPMMANFIICVSIFALGHLTPIMVKSSIGDFAPVVFVARLFATVFPVLEYFDIKPAIAGGVPVPLDYLAWALLYCVLYSTVAMLLALTLFEDRDLA